MLPNEIIKQILLGREGEELQGLEAQVLDQVLSGGLAPGAPVAPPQAGLQSGEETLGQGVMSTNRPEARGLMETIFGFGSPQIQETALGLTGPGVRKGMEEQGPKLQRGEPYEAEMPNGDIQWITPIYDMNRGGAMVNAIPQPGRVAGKGEPMFKIDPDGFLIQRNFEKGQTASAEKSGWTKGKRSTSKAPLVKVSRLLPSGDVVSITTDHDTAQNIIREQGPVPPGVASYVEGLKSDTILGDIQGVPKVEKLLTPREIEEKIMGSQQTLAQLKATGGVTETVIGEMMRYDPGFAKFLRASGADIATCEKLIVSYQKMLLERLPKKRREELTNILFGETQVQKLRRVFGTK